MLLQVTKCCRGPKSMLAPRNENSLLHTKLQATKNTSGLPDDKLISYSAFRSTVSVTEPCFQLAILENIHPLHLQRCCQPLPPKSRPMPRIHAEPHAAASAHQWLMVGHGCAVPSSPTLGCGVRQENAVGRPLACLAVRAKKSRSTGKRQAL